MDTPIVKQNISQPAIFTLKVLYTISLSKSENSWKHFKAQGNLLKQDLYGINCPQFYPLSVKLMTEEIPQELNLSAVLLQRICNFGFFAKSQVFASCCSYSCKETDNQQRLKLFYIYIECEALFSLSVCI